MTTVDVFFGRVAVFQGPDMTGTLCATDCTVEVFVEFPRRCFATAEPGRTSVRFVFAGDVVSFKDLAPHSHCFIERCRPIDIRIWT